MMKLKIEVKKINYVNWEDGFYILDCKVVENLSMETVQSKLTLKGIFVREVQPKDTYLVEGEIEHSKYGTAFKVSKAELVVGNDIKAVKHYLISSVRGLGEVTANKIIKAYGLNSIHKCEDVENLLSLGLKEKLATRISFEVKRNENAERVIQYLLERGVGYNKIIKAYKQFGDLTVVNVVKNPYILCQEEVGIDFKTVDMIAKCNGIQYNDQRRVKQAVKVFLSNKVNGEGHLYTPLQTIIDEINPFLNGKSSNSQNGKGVFSGFGLLTRVEIENAIDELADKLELYRDEDAIYFYGNYCIEDTIIDGIVERATENADFATTKQVKEAIEVFQNAKNIKLAEEQKQAVITGLTKKLSILTGGPGTGKTQTVNAMINCIKTIDPTAKVELCAPTGRASRRMAELTGMPAQTIHRLIGLNPNIDSVLNEIEADFVIVDESSMIDASLFSLLLQQLTENVNLIIVGDANQLPSVGAGLVLRDLIDTNVVTTTKLTQIFRQAQDSNIVMNAHAIVNGSTDIKYNTGCKDFFFVEKDAPIATEADIIKSVHRLIALGENARDIQILAPQRTEICGTDKLNQLCQEALNPGNKPAIKVGNRTFKLGDRVIQTENNYEIEVFNGEIGYVSRVENFGNGDYELYVDYDGKEVMYERGQLDQIELAYAITIHKSQGSEFKNIIMPITTVAKNNTRNLVYTGITRAKNKVILAGSKEALNNAIANIDNTVRLSKIKEGIIERVMGA